MTDEQLLDLLEGRLRTVRPDFCIVIPYEFAGETADAIARLRTPGPSYDVPPQTLREILEELP